MKGWLEICQLQDFDSSRSVLAGGGLDYRETAVKKSKGQISGCSASEVLQSCKYLPYWSQCKMASDVPDILHNGKQIKKNWTHHGAMVLPFNPAGTIDSLGAALHTAAAGADAGQQWPKAACAIAAMSNEGKLGQHRILVFRTLLVLLTLEGLGTARGQAQYLVCLLRIIGDYTVKWILQSFSYVWASAIYPELWCSTVLPPARLQPTGKCVLTPIALCQIMLNGAQDKPKGVGGEFRATLSV